MKTTIDQKTDQKSDIEKKLGLGQSQGKKKGLRAVLLIAVLLIAALIVTAITLNGTGKANLIEYKTQPAQIGDMTVTVEATGTLQPTNQEVNVGSELSGIVKSVEVDYNDEVKVGQVLARLDPEKLNAQVIQSRAGLESARAKVLQAQATVAEALSKLKRLEQLHELSNKKLPSQNDLDVAEAILKRAQADEASARAMVAEAQAELEARETDLSKAVIRSPINGLVLQRGVEPGQTVAASLQAPVLFILAADLRQMELHVDVDEADVGQVKEGQEATFTVDAFPDRIFPARITQVRYAAQTVNGVVTYETILKVDNKDLLLRPGMTATASIVVRQFKDTLLVPNAALRFEPPPDEDQNQKQNTSVMSMLIPFRRRGRPNNRHNNKEPLANKNQRQVWSLSEGKPVPVPLTIGFTDGRMTEVRSGDVQAGLPLVVDTMRPGR